MDLMKYRIKKDYKYLYKFLNFDYEVFLCSTGEEIEIRFKELLSEGIEKGYTPLLIFPSDILEEMLEILVEEICISLDSNSINKWREEIILESKSILAEDILRENLMAIWDDYNYKEKEINDIIEVFNIFEEEKEEDKTEGKSLLSAFNMDYKQVIIGKIPTLNVWELPAWIPIGGFNNCPMVEEQIAVFKMWNEKYGAVPQSVSYNTWELFLNNPINEEDELEEIAKYHIGFCEDLINYNPDKTLKELKNKLRGAKIWDFWWE